MYKDENHTKGFVHDDFVVIPWESYNLTTEQVNQLNDLINQYNEMPIDNYLNSGEGVRSRRYSKILFSKSINQFRVCSSNTFRQSAFHNRLYGDQVRVFSPLSSITISNPLLLALIRADIEMFCNAKNICPNSWGIGIHMIRISTSVKEPIGRPAPEGIHRDGVNFVSVRLMGRNNIAGARSNIYSENNTKLAMVSLKNTLDTYVLDDQKTLHSVSKFTPLNNNEIGYRDILAFLYEPSVDNSDEFNSSIKLVEKVNEN